jgi:peptidyl-prolyl cis-trans isomerase C
MSKYYWFTGLLLLALSALLGAVEQKDQVLIHGPEVDLTLQDLRTALSAMPLEVREATMASPKQLRKAMDQTYLTKVAAHRALKKGLDKSPQVQAKVENYRRNVLADAEVSAVVEQQVMASKDALLEAARELYQANRKAFEEPERVAVRHILLKHEEGMDDEALLEKARKLRKDILAGKLQFEVAAAKFSADEATSRKGGLLTPFARGKMVKPFENAAFALKEGEISEPVKTRFWYHLIRLERRIPKKRVDFESVRDNLMEQVKAKEINRLRTEYWLKVRDDPEARLNEELVKRMLDSPAVLLDGAKKSNIKLLREPVK